jgi:iron complex outermembrane recepter protein
VLLALTLSQRSGAEPAVDGDADTDGRTAMELRVIEVVGTTPLTGTGLPLGKVSGNVQISDDKDIRRHEAANVTDFMRRNLGSVFANETLANPFQPDVSYRGFTASPVLGTPIGLSVYQDGVRVNEPFGDVVNWDLIPRAAIANIDLIPGSNPLFGLNTLGGALSVRTKSGISHPGTRAQAYGGSFDRWNLEGEHGGSYKNFDWFLAGNVFEEGGFRNFSRSTVHQGFAKVGWENGTTDIDLTYTYADNKLTGNGVAPQSHVSRNPSAVYAHPEVTRPELHFLNLMLIHGFSDTWLLSGNAYFRHSANRVEAGDIELTQEVPDDFAIDPVLNRTRTRQSGWGGSFEISYTGKLFDRDNHAVVGSTFNFGDTDFEQFRQPAEIDPTRGVTAEAGSVSQLRTRLNATNAYYGFFFTDTYSPTPWFNLTGSVRWNHADIQLQGTTVDEEAETEPLLGDHGFERANPAAGFTLQP